MIWYAATWPNDDGQKKALDRAEVSTRLISFAESATWALDLLEEHQREGVELLLDSGAFTAWSTGREIDLDAYAAFVADFGHLCNRYFNLDVIPGRKGRPPPSEHEIEQAAVHSYANLQTLKRAGLHPIPIFHQGDSPSWLKRMLDDGETLLGIAPSKTAPRRSQQSWLQQVFAEVDGTDVRLHGLGVSSFGLLCGFPWYSCDGSTWARTAATGAILIPTYMDGEADYARRPTKLTVSNRNWRSWDAWPVSPEYVHAFLSRECGTDMTSVTNHVDARLLVNATYFARLSQSICRRKNDGSP